MAGHELPPILTGTEQQQLVAMRDYLVRLAQSLDTVSSAKVVTETAKTGNARTRKSGSSAAADSVTMSDVIAQATALRSLIIKTAEQIESNVAGNYVANSTFGTYQEIVARDIEDTAKSTIEHYNYAAIVSGIVGDDISAIKTYIQQMDGEIKRGVIYDEERGIDVFGIAISQNLQLGEAVINDGEGGDNLTYYRVEGMKTFGLYTSYGWQFWIEGKRVGWFDSTANDGALHIASAVVQDHIQMGDSWMLDITDDGGGIGFRYIGA